MENFGKEQEALLVVNMYSPDGRSRGASGGKAARFGTAEFALKYLTMRKGQFDIAKGNNESRRKLFSCWDANHHFVTTCTCISAFLHMCLDWKVSTLWPKRAFLACKKQICIVNERSKGTLFWSENVCIGMLHFASAKHPKCHLTDLSESMIKLLTWSPRGFYTKPGLDWRLLLKVTRI